MLILAALREYKRSTRAADTAAAGQPGGIIIGGRVDVGVAAASGTRTPRVRPRTRRGSVDRGKLDLPADDERLIARAQQGDAAALERLVLKHQDRLHNLCLRLCNSPADAADLAQSTLVRAFEALPRFEARAGFYTWLFRIAVNLSISQRRRQRSAPRLSIDGDPADGPAAAHIAGADGRPDDRLIRQEQHERLAAALAELDDEFRAAVILKDVEDLDYATIAEILEVPVGTVKSRIHRGRTILRHALSGVEGPRTAGGSDPPRHEAEERKRDRVRT